MTSTTNLAVVVVMFGAWEGFGRAGVVDPFYSSMPSSIVARIWEWCTGGDIYTHLAITLAETILSFGIGTLLGISLGLWLGLSKLAAMLEKSFRYAKAEKRQQDKQTPPA